MSYTQRREDVNVPPALVVSGTQFDTSHRWDKAHPTCFRDETAKKYILCRYGWRTTPAIPPSEFPRARVDWRLGPHEPMQYPQLWDHSAPHLAWIERSPSHVDLYSASITGYVLQLVDWTPIHAQSVYGRVSQPVVSRLREAFYAIYNLVIPLFAEARTKHLLPKRTISECTKLLAEFQTVAAAFKDSALNVTRVQRGIAELRGFYRFRMDCRYHVQHPYFVSDVLYDYVGVFVTDVHLCSLLHRLGVPVWLVLDRIPKDVSLLSQPPTPCSDWVEMHLLDAVQLPARGRALAVRSSQIRARSRSPLSERSKRVARSPTSASASNMWIKRNFIADPQMQVGQAVKNGQVELPEWAPDPLPWLFDICSLVDTTEERQRRLCAVDVEYAVPQSIFLRGPLYLMPPVHIFYKKNAIASEIAFRCWASLDTFWVSRVTQEDESTLGPGLSSPTWRSYMENKYKPRTTVTAANLNVIESSASSNAGQTSREPAAGASTSATITQAPKPAASSESETSLERRASQLESEIQNALIAAAYESDDDSDDDDGMPAMFNADEPRVYYTRDPVPGERPFTPEEQRDSVLPSNWENTMLDFFVEEDSRRMTKASQKRKKEVRFSRGWDKFDDFENRRRLFFMRSSRVASEFPQGGERRIAANVLTWHRDPNDEVGRAYPSKYIWPVGIPRSKKRAAEKLAYVVTADEAVADGIPFELIGKTKQEVEEEMLKRGAWTVETTWPSRRAEKATAALVQQAQTADQPEPAQAQTQAPAPVLELEPDPIFGTHAPVPSGRGLSEFRFGSHVVTAEDLKKVEYRKFILWRIQEASFRFQLRTLDMYVLKSMGVWDDDVAAERARLWPQCWGRGSESFVPRGDVEPLLSRDSNPVDRFLGLIAFSRLVHSWPRAETYKSIQQYTRLGGEGLQEDQIPVVERSLWRLYAQTYYDYFGLMPTLPAKMPPNPFPSPVSE
ncbi:hypothetical protein EXIGLDRAFT_770039 [Exidia glandulosa HHB12029]|uniref:Uncharacterized protein n=1 Tax=Exidia glandulosa HHB12029 TaxID=1314781 RepID=A0A165GZY2_EXIGL|nr:hypothetical protein EXIGLDRAFT_770039 [Exidia glandulosa HHB12029]